MQNIKKIFIFSIFMIYSIECLADKALIHAGENAAKTLASAITDVAQTLAPVVVDAALHNIPTLMTTASMPARGFFEKLCWNGDVIQTHYPIAEKDVVLPQFQCVYQIPKDFKDF